jgi:hypothetical protein
MLEYLNEEEEKWAELDDDDDSRSRSPSPSPLPRFGTFPQQSANYDGHAISLFQPVRTKKRKRPYSEPSSPATTISEELDDYYSHPTKKRVYLGRISPCFTCRLELAAIGKRIASLKCKERTTNAVLRSVSRMLADRQCLCKSRPFKSEGQASLDWSFGGPVQPEIVAQLEELSKILSLVGLLHVLTDDNKPMTHVKFAILAPAPFRLYRDMGIVFRPVHDVDDKTAPCRRSFVWHKLFDRNVVGIIGQFASWWLVPSAFSTLLSPPSSPFE